MSRESKNFFGRKTANVVLNSIFGLPTMPVDTHILRLSRRLGFCDEAKPERVEAALLKRIPAEFLKNAHHHLVLHGRHVCTAKNPQCEKCSVSTFCKKNFQATHLTKE